MDPNDREQTRTAWDGIAARYDETNTPTQMWLGNEGLVRAGLGPGMRFLDVAAGSGALAIPAARLGARVTAVDLSPAMLDRLAARARAESLPIETRVMDGHALDFEDGTFDVAGSQFGVMLFPDMPRGVRELARVTRPGGRVLMIAYGNPAEIDFFAFFVQAIRTVVPDFTGPPIDPPPLPFQLQDPEVLRAALTRAGLQEARVATITERTVFSSGDELWLWITGSNPIVGHLLAELALTGEQTDRVRRALDRLVRARAGGDGAATLANPINIGVGVKESGPARANGGGGTS
jgi:ubiquinone/menaquinone biosynthesis C-methylase UbiE